MELQDSAPTRTAKTCRLIASTTARARFVVCRRRGRSTEPTAATSITLLFLPPVRTTSCIIARRSTRSRTREEPGLPASSLRRRATRLVRRRRIVIFSPATSAESTAAAPRAPSPAVAAPAVAASAVPRLPPCAVVGLLARVHARRVDHPEQDANKGDGEEDAVPAHFLLFLAAASRFSVTAAAAAAFGASSPPSTAPTALEEVRVPLLALVGQDEAVLDAAAALEHVLVVGRGVALADDVGAAQLERGREVCGAGPLFEFPDSSVHYFQCQAGRT